MKGIENLQVDAYTIPTDTPEADGTLAWNDTTLVVVRLRCSGTNGIGYTYADTSCAHLIEHRLGPRVLGRDAMAPEAIWATLYRSVRNLGREGIASMAIAAVDSAVWDLKGRLLNLSLTALLSRVRDSVPVYGSGGFTSYSDKQLKAQLGGWARSGIRAVKMKVGTHPERDPGRVRIAREAIGKAELYVDANGAYDCRQALEMAHRFAESGVTWFEEPVSSNDLRGLRFLRERTPAAMEIAAGEYGYTTDYFRRMLAASAVDVLQADATRCGGVTGFLKAATVAEAFDCADPAWESVLHRFSRAKRGVFSRPCPHREHVV